MTNAEIILWAGAVGAVVAALVSATVLLINGWRQRVAESKRHKVDTESANIRHLRELALEAAIADWKHSIEVSEKWTPDTMRCQSEHDRPRVDPLDQFLIRKLKMIQVFGDGSISVKDLPAKWAEMAEFIKWIKGPSSSIRGTTTENKDTEQGVGTNGP